MTTKFALVALLSTLAVPAFANDGHKMQADLLKLDASRYTTNELAQIDGEDSATDRLARIRLIEEEKATGATSF